MPYNQRYKQHQHTIIDNNVLYIYFRRSGCAAQAIRDSRPRRVHARLRPESTPPCFGARLRRYILKKYSYFCTQHNFVSCSSMKIRCLCVCVCVCVCSTTHSDDVLFFAVGGVGSGRRFARCANLLSALLVSLCARARCNARCFAVGRVIARRVATNNMAISLPFFFCRVCRRRRSSVWPTMRIDS